MLWIIDLALLAASVAELARLRDRIGELEVQNARLRAGASCTRPREDPSVHEFRRAANEEAYEQDAKGFR